jgi:hypothetical protein
VGDLLASAAPILERLLGPYGGACAEYKAHEGSGDGDDPTALDDEDVDAAAAPAADLETLAERAGDRRVAVSRGILPSGVSAAQDPVFIELRRRYEGRLRHQ